MGIIAWTCEKGIENTCLTRFLGFEHFVGVECLCTTGHLKIRNNRTPHSTMVAQSESEKIVIEEQLSEIVETEN